MPGRSRRRAYRRPRPIRIAQRARSPRYRILVAASIFLRRPPALRAPAAMPPSDLPFRPDEGIYP